MKALVIVFMLLVLTAACASTDSDKSDFRIKYGGSYTVRAGVSHGVDK